MQYLKAFSATCITALFGLIGALLVIFGKKNLKYKSLFFGVSAGVMLYTVFYRLLPDGFTRLIPKLGTLKSSIILMAALLCGIILIRLIGLIFQSVDGQKDCLKQNLSGLGVSKNASTPHYNLVFIEESTRKHLKVLCKYIILAMSVDNFIDGLLSFSTVLGDPSLAPGIIIALGIHNIAEGIAIASPVFFASKSRAKALIFTGIAAIAEPLGGIFYLFLHPFLTDVVNGIVIGMLCGVMLCIVLKEMLPKSFKENVRLTAGGILCGVAIMLINNMIIF